MRVYGDVREAAARPRVAVGQVYAVTGIFRSLGNRTSAYNDSKWLLVIFLF